MTVEERQEEGMSDHDRLIRMESKLDILINQFSGHVKRHWAVELMLLAAVVAYVFSKFSQAV